MATDVKNNAGGDSGSSYNGRAVIYTGARAGTAAQKKAVLDSPMIEIFTLAGFDTSPPGCILADRLDDPRHYTGDTTS